MRFCTFLLVLLSFAPNPLLAQSTACTPDQIAVFNNRAFAIAEAMQTAYAAGTLGALDDFQQAYWADYAPQLPDCTLGIQMRQAFGRRIDEALIAQLYAALGDREQELVHRTAALSASTEMIEAFVAQTASTVSEDEPIALGDVVATSNLDRNGCPVDALSHFPSGTNLLFVAATDSTVPTGTDVFVRWYYEGEVYDESDQITADRDYTRTCIGFSLEADTISSLRDGKYRAEFIINGNPAADVIFKID